MQMQQVHFLAHFADLLRELSKEHLQEEKILTVLKHFLDYEQANPKCVFLDSVAAQKRLMSRTEMAMIFSEIPKREEVCCRQ